MTGRISPGATRRYCRRVLLGALLPALALSGCNVPRHKRAASPAPITITITISPSSVLLAQGTVETFIARVSDVRGRELTNVPIRWRSLDNRTLTIDSSGTATGLAVGETRIFAEAAGHRSPQIPVQVVPPGRVPRPVRTVARGAAAGSVASLTGAVVQLQNYQHDRLDALARAGFSLAVIDLARDAGSSYFTADEIGQLKRSGTKVLAYFEIGSIENFRPDFAYLRKHDGDLFLNEWPSWPGEYFVRYWDPRWWNLVIKPRIDRALDAGFDGVFLDTPLAYEELDASLVPGETRAGLARRMVALIARISKYAKAADPGFLVFPNNSPELQRYPGYTEAIDGIGMESMFFLPNDIPCTDPYCTTNLDGARALRKAGKAVLAIDYADKPQNVAAACRRYREEHFIGYVAPEALNTIRPACPK
jgi:cysteinyl-tRNA synthetase